MKLLYETNDGLEGTVGELRAERQAAEAWHGRVIEKFGKLRDTLMGERSKPEAAEARTCRAETLAGKGSYNLGTTRVVHLESNLLADATRERQRAEIGSLERRLEEAAFGPSS